MTDTVKMDWLELTRIKGDLLGGKPISHNELVAAFQFSIKRIRKLEDVLDDVSQAIRQDWREK